MPKYITRIELLDGEEHDYQQFNQEISKFFFSKTKTSLTSLRHGLARWEEYTREGNITMQGVTEAVYKAAKLVGKKFSFTIIKDKGMQYSGLR